MTRRLDSTDRAIINRLQEGLPLVEAPYAAVAQELGIAEAELLARLRRLLKERALTRFGPLFNMDALGGAVELAAMRVPQERFDAVAEKVNAHVEVAHNYARDHAFNMWFVLAAESRARLDAVAGKIEEETGLKVWRFPKEKEYFIGLKVPA